MEFTFKDYDFRVVEKDKKKLVFYVKKYPIMEIGKVESELIGLNNGHMGSKIKIEGNFINPDIVVDAVAYYYENFNDNIFDKDDWDDEFSKE